MTDADHIAKPAMTHALVRTSPKGEVFLGTCTQCGTQNLPRRAALETCPNQRGLSQDEALIETIGRNHE